MSRVRFCIFDAVLAVSLCCFAQLVEAEAQKTDPSEVHALRAIKHSLIDRYENLKSWNKGDPCLMKWKGVSCFNTTKADNYLHVQKLHLLNMNLSGSLSPELGRLSYLTILDFMWNEISGSIPKEIGQIKSLELLILNRNKLSDSLPDELGYLPNLILLQIDDNNISGPLPKSFANLEKIWHLHMNNNSISGEIPTELSRLPVLIHLLLDNNNLSGNLPSELSQLPSLNVLQLDNNHFDGRAIPASYSNMSNLVKLSLRNCSLQGRIPDLSGMPHLKYLDLSWNHLTGSIPSNILINITTIDLSYNNLDGSIPTSFSSLPQLQKLSIENNSLSGVIPSTIWQNMTFESKLFLYFQNNLFSNISGDLNPPVNVVIRLSGNPVCENVNQLNRTLFCGSQTGGELGPGSSIKPTNASSGELEPGSSMKPNASSNMSCPTDDFFECVAVSPSVQCFCAAPLGVWYRLKSPSFSYFPPYRHQFEEYLASNLQLQHYQLAINSCAWEAGPRLSMYLKIFPVFDKNVSKFNDSEITRIEDIFTGWSMPVLPIFGPYELISFTLLGPYTYENLKPSTSGITKGVLAGILLGAVAGAISLSAIISILIMRRCTNYYHEVSRRRLSSKISIKIDGVKDFTFREMASATDNFSESTQVGQGGYGNVYKGILADGTVVAIKRAREGSLQGKKEFLTEIELLSRLHHRNLVSLLGYCSEEEEQMLVYEFMPNGTLRDCLCAKEKEPLCFNVRFRIALCSARGILYLHTEADPPIFHRDIKATNILLDCNFTAKVADFGLSRLAPLPEIEGTAAGYVSTLVKGTPGYLDPEYVLTHKLTDKSDVYSLGVVFLELLTGMRPISHGKNIVREVNVAYKSGLMFSIIDSRMGTYPADLVAQFISLALRCCEDETDSRPSMADVVRELEDIMRRLPDSALTLSEFTTSDWGSGTMSSKTTEPFVSSDISGTTELHSSMGAPIIRAR